MPLLQHARRYWLRSSGYTNANSEFATGRFDGLYKPRALRIPSLLCLFFLFTISFTALELLLGKTVKPSEFYKSHGLKAPEKRQLATPTCPPAEENESILDSLRLRQSALCTTYTTEFKPSTTDLSLPMQTSFDSWLAAYSAMELQSEFAESCAASQSFIVSLSSLLGAFTSADTTASQTLPVQALQTSASEATSPTIPSSNGPTATTTVLPSTTVDRGATSTLSTLQPLTSDLVTSIARTIAPTSSESQSDSNSVQSGSVTFAATSTGTPGDSISPQAVPSSTSTSTVFLSVSSLSSLGTTTSTTAIVTSNPTSISTTSNNQTSPVTTPSTTFSTSSISSESNILNIISTPTSTLSFPPDPTTSTSTGTNLSDTFFSTTTTTTTTTTATESTCTELNSVCFDCGEAYCICSSSNDPNFRKRDSPHRGNLGYSEYMGKRQNVLSCVVDPCHCVTTGEELNYSCSPENQCDGSTTTSATSATLSILTTTSSVSNPTTTSTQPTQSFTGPIITPESSTSTTHLLSSSGSTNLTTTTSSTVDYGVTTTTTTNNTTTKSDAITTTTGNITTTDTTTTTTTNNATTTTTNDATTTTTDATTTTDTTTTTTNNATTTTTTTDAITTTTGNTTTTTTDNATTITTTSNATTTTIDTTTTTTNNATTTTTSNATVTTTDTTTTISSSAQPVCTETGAPCSECGQDYCLCDGGDCVVDTCHCVPSETEGWVCGLEDTCESSTICIAQGDTCHTCEAQFCTCGHLPAKRQYSLTCIVDECFCQWNATSSIWVCDAYNGCECPAGNNGQACSSCDASECICDTGECAETSTPVGNSTTSVTTTTATTTTTSDYVTTSVTSSVTTSVTTSVVVVNNNAASTTTATALTTTTSQTRDPPLPGATCAPSTGRCYNCVADRCACEADGYCYPDECWCDRLGPGDWSCGTIDRCNPDACDTSQLQCFGCNGSNATAPCYCSSAGVCGNAPCPSCEFTENGTVMTCPDGCESVGKRSVGWNSSSISASAPHPRKIPLRGNWGMMDKRQGFEILTGEFRIPVRDAWNYLLWTEPLTVRRTSSSLVSTTTAATFTLDVFDNPRSTSWPLLPTTPPLLFKHTTPACIPATLIAPAATQTTILKRDVDIKTVKPYVTRESTTVVVRIRDNYLQLTSNIPTVTRLLPTSVQNQKGSLVYQMETVTMTVESIGPDGERQSQSVVVVKPSVVATGEGPQETNDSPPSDRTSIASLSDDKRVVQAKVTGAIYFAALYLPPLMAVAIKILYETIVASIKMMEPFERLHRAEGSTADDSLSSQYLSSSVSFDVLSSIWGGRSIPLWTLIIYILITVSAPLSSASMTIRPMDTCHIGNGQFPCLPAWVVDLTNIRILEAFLGVCMALTLVLAWDSWNYHAGVPSNPTSIAAVAVLLNYEPLRSDIQEIDPNASEAELSKALQQYHFWLLPHQPSRAISRYGIIHSPISVTKPASWVEKLERLRRILFFESRGLDCLHILTMVALFALLITYRADTRNDAFNYFFASSRFWPKFIVVGVAGVIDMQWKNLEREVRIMEPYRRLHCGNARPENTILWPMNGTCWSNLPRCLGAIVKYDRMWFEALVGLTAIISDVNIIAVAGLLMSQSQIRTAYEWSSITALLCTGFMCCVLALAMLWWRRSVSMISRKPETIGAVLSYLCVSRMAVDFAAMRMEHMSARQRDSMIISLRRRYRFGLMMGEDGEQRYCVDYDDGELSSDGMSERDRWLQDKVAAPAAVRVSL